MKRTFSFFFLLVMLLNVTLPLVELLQGRDKYELTEVSTDKDEKGKTEKEKELLSFSACTDLYLTDSGLEKFRRSLFATDDLPISELYASLPEVPPKV